MHVRSLFVLALSAALLGAACDTPTGFDAQRSSNVVVGSKSVIVGFNAHPSAAEIALIQSFGGAVTRQFKYVRAVAATIPSAQEDALRAAAGVRFVEDNVTLTPFGNKQITDYGVSLIQAPAEQPANADERRRQREAQLIADAHRRDRGKRCTKTNRAVARTDNAQSQTRSLHFGRERSRGQLDLPVGEEIRRIGGARRIDNCIGGRAGTDNAIRSANSAAINSAISVGTPCAAPRNFVNHIPSAASTTTGDDEP